MNDFTQQLHDSGTTALVGNARFGYHSLPQAMLDDYAAAEKHIAEHTDSRGRIILDQAQRDHAEDLANRAMSHIAYGNGQAIITDYLQPALASLLDQVRADRATAGRYSSEQAASIDMLTENDDVRAAIVRLHGITPHYGALRVSWEILRRRDSIKTTDPLDTRSPLGEVANMPDLYADWEKAHHGRTAWPWSSTALHIKLGWLLDNGGHIWLPTADEQTQAWSRYQPQARRTVFA